MTSVMQRHSHQAQPAEGLDGKFLAIDPDWYLGADGILSTPIGPNRIFWMFGDTLLGKLRDGVREIGEMPRNTIAIQDTSAGIPGKIDWYWQSENGVPRSFFRIHDDVDQLWFWPGTAFFFDGKLFVLGYGITPADGEIESMSFDVKHPWLVVVENPQEHPHRWRKTDRALKFAESNLFFSSAHYMDDEFLYIFGFRCPKAGWFAELKTSMARIPLVNLSEDEWEASSEYLSEEGAWSKESNNIAELYNPAVTESSVYYDAPRERFIATTYIPAEPHFLLTQAPRIEGPWTAPAIVYTDPEHEKDSSLFSYTFRIHRHLSPSPDELIFSYAVNGCGLKEILPRPEIYYPRFVKLDLTKF